QDVVDGGKAFRYARPLVVRETAARGPRESENLLPRAIAVAGCKSGYRGRLAGDRDHLYFMLCNRLDRVRRDGGRVELIVESTDAASFTLDDDSVYRMRPAMRTPKNGGAGRELKGSCESASQIVADQEAIYCLSAYRIDGKEGERIVRQPKR